MVRTYNITSLFTVSFTRVGFGRATRPARSDAPVFLCLAKLDAQSPQLPPIAAALLISSSHSLYTKKRHDYGMVSTSSGKAPREKQKLPPWFEILFLHIATKSKSQVDVTSTFHPRVSLIELCRSYAATVSVWRVRTLTPASATRQKQYNFLP